MCSIHFTTVFKTVVKYVFNTFFTTVLKTVVNPDEALSRLGGHRLPETAPDENKSVLAAVLRHRMYKTRLVENFSHKSSMLFLQYIFHDCFENSREICIQYIFHDCFENSRGKCMEPHARYKCHQCQIEMSNIGCNLKYKRQI